MLRALVQRFLFVFQFLFSLLVVCKEAWRLTHGYLDCLRKSRTWDLDFWNWTLRSMHLLRRPLRGDVCLVCSKLQRVTSEQVKIIHPAVVLPTSNVTNLFPQAWVGVEKKGVPGPQGPPCPPLLPSSTPSKDVGVRGAKSWLPLPRAEILLNLRASCEKARTVPSFSGSERSKLCETRGKAEILDYLVSRRGSGSRVHGCDNICQVGPTVDLIGWQKQIKRISVVKTFENIICSRPQCCGTGPFSVAPSLRTWTSGGPKPF